MRNGFEVSVSLILCLCIMVMATVVDSVGEPSELAIETILPSTEELAIYQSSWDGLGTCEKRLMMKTQQVAEVLQVRIRSPSARCKSHFLVNLECFDARDQGKSSRLPSFG